MNNEKLYSYIWRWNGREDWTPANRNHFTKVAAAEEARNHKTLVPQIDVEVHEVFWPVHTLRIFKEKALYVYTVLEYNKETTDVA